MTEEKPNKLTSRKFIAWAVWTLLTFAIIVLSFIKDLDAELIGKTLGSYALVTSFYIGGNVAGKAINTYKEVNSEGVASD